MNHSRWERPRPGSSPSVKREDEETKRTIISPALKAERWANVAVYEDMIEQATAAELRRDLRAAYDDLAVANNRLAVMAEQILKLKARAK